MSACAQEMCPNWGGDGRVCPCAMFGIEPDDLDPEPDVNSARPIPSVCPPPEKEHTE